MANRIKIYNGSGFIDADVSTIGGHSPSEFAKKSHTHDFGTDITNRGEAFLDWGGKNFKGSFGPIDAAMMPALGANRFAFAYARGITVEYSRDNGETWTDYGLADADKVTIFSGPKCMSNIKIGKPTYNSSTGKFENTSVNNRVRVIVDTNSSTGCNIYTVLNKFIFNISTNGSGDCKVTIDAQTKANSDAGNDTWETFANGTGITGWSGYNVVNTSNFATYGNSPSQYTKIRFTFYCTVDISMETNGGLSILNIYGFGGMGWKTPSYMSSWGSIYTYDADKNVIFPAGVRATYFSENGKALSSKYLGINANAVSATKATQDGNGNVINSTYETKNEGIAVLSSIGWYRVAEHSSGTTSNSNGLTANSCELIIKRVYQNGNNEYHQIQFLSTYNNQSFKSIDKSNLQLFTKIRYSIDNATNKSYLEVYYNYDKANDVYFKINNGKDAWYKWSVITPVATSETVNGVTITATYDIPANTNPVNSLDIPTKTSQLTNDSGFLDKTGTIGKSNKLVSSNYRPTSANFDHDYIQNYVSQRLDIVSSSMTTGKPVAQGYIITYFWDNNNESDTQLYIPNNNNINIRPQIRYKMGPTSWENSSWISIPYMSDIPTKVSQLENDSNFVALVDNLIPSQYLPSYVDDVLEYENMAEIPQTGESGKIYVDKTTNKTYRWSGTTYVEISPSLALGETSSTAYAGDKGKANATAIETLKGYFNSDGIALRALNDSVGNPISTSYVNLGTEQTIRAKKYFNGGLAITNAPENKNMEVFLGIDKFSNGGTVKWINKSDIKLPYSQITGTPTIPTKISQLENDSNYISGNVVSNISSQYDDQDIPTAKFLEDYVANKVPSKTTTTIFDTLTSLNTNATAVGVFTTKSITLTDSVQSGDKLKVYLCGNSYYEQYCAGIIEFELFNPSTSSDRNMVSGAGMIMPTIGEQKFIVSASVQNTMSTTTSLSIVVYTLTATSGAPAGANNINVLKVERIR